jgi:hypothetical protein
MRFSDSSHRGPRFSDNSHRGLRFSDSSRRDLRFSDSSHRGLRFSDSSHKVKNKDHHSLSNPKESRNPRRNQDNDSPEEDLKEGMQNRGGRETP